MEFVPDLSVPYILQNALQYTTKSNIPSQNVVFVELELYGCCFTVNKIFSPVTQIVCL